MKLNLNLKPYFKYLFIPAIVLLVAGGVAGFLTKQWTVLYLSLIFIGETLFILWLIYLFVTHRKFWHRRSTQAGTNALISTLSLIIILGLINFLVVRYTQPIDLSENQLYTLSPQSQELVKKLDQPLKIWLFEKDPHPNDKKLLDNYRRYNSNFSYEYVDPSVKLSIAKEFDVKNIGEVHFEYKNKKQLVQNLIEFNQKQPLSETKITNAIEKIQRNYTPSVYLLQGHGELSLSPQEGSLSQAIDALKEKGFKIEPLNISQTSIIPKDADAIILASPKSELFPQELTLLEQYSEQGGNLLLMIDPNTEPKLESLLKDWGVELDPRIVIDASGRGEALGFGPATIVITNYGDHPITKELKERYSIYPLTRPIGTFQKEDIEAVSLVVTDERMWGESNLESPEIIFDPETDIAGPFDIGVALKRTIKPKDNQDKFLEAKMVIFGNSTFATDGWFNEQFNEDVFLNSVQWLVNQTEDALSIRPKERENRRISLTPLKASIIAWMALLIMPILGLGMAGFVWWKRR